MSAEVFYAAEHNDLEVVKLHIEKNDFSKIGKNAQGETLTDIAARQGHTKMLKYLMEKDPSSQDRLQSLLGSSVVSGALDVVKYLIEECKAKVCYVVLLDHYGRDYREYPPSNYHRERNKTIFGSHLEEAVKYGRMNVLKYFIERRNHSVDHPCEYFSSFRSLCHPPPIFVALMYRQPDIFKYLVEEKKANLKIRDVGGTEENILFEAVRKDNLQVIKYVLDERKTRLDLNMKNWMNETLIHEAVFHAKTTILEYLVVQKHVSVNFEDGYKTPLHYAAWKGHFEALQFLIEHGAHINQCDKDGNTAQMWATSEHVWKYLLERGADINKLNNDGFTPLHLATWRNYYKACKYLIKKGADVNKVDNKGETALHVAVSRDRYKICRYLVEHNAKVNLENKRGKTPLHGAILNGCGQLSKYLIEHGGDVSKEVSGTAMHVAAASNRVDVLSYLVEERHADVNATRNRDNWTPLHCAAFRGSLDAVKYLIEHRANTHVEDKYGKTPAQIASDVKVIAYMNSTATMPRARRSVDCASSLTFQMVPYCRSSQMITDGGQRLWNLSHFSSESSSAASVGSLAPQLQSFFFLFHFMEQNLYPLTNTSGTMHTLQNRIESVAENAIEALPKFENERLLRN